MTDLPEEAQPVVLSRRLQFVAELTHILPRQSSDGLVFFILNLFKEVDFTLILYLMLLGEVALLIRIFTPERDL